MTDRIAALAEALILVERDFDKRHHDPEHGPWREDPIYEALLAEESAEKAAAILAALPPDWCGHEPVAGLRAERLRLIESQQTEIARLRKIEEAAREYLPFVRDLKQGGVEAERALRAALDMEKEAGNA